MKNEPMSTLVDEQLLGRGCASIRSMSVKATLRHLS